MRVVGQIFLIIILFSSMNIDVFCSSGKKQRKSKKVSYKPPYRGMPQNRVFGGSRSISKSNVFLTIIAPDHTGYTLQAQPNLYWYIDRDLTGIIEFTIIDPDNPDPLLETRLNKKISKGIHRLSLQTENVYIKKEIEYQWFAALVVEPDDRSQDIVTSGFIKRMNQSGDISKQLEHYSNAELTSRYAEKGLWYDAYDNIMSTLKTNTRNDTDNVNIHRLLLEQINLNMVADFVSRDAN